jgi:hypothetical protein
LGAIVVLTGLGIEKEAGMHEILQSQGICRCVVCANSLSDAVLFLSSSKTLVSLRYCCISTKQLNRTPNNEEINRKEHKPEQKKEQIKPRNQNVRTDKTKNRTNELKINEHQHNQKMKKEEPLRDGCNG